MKKHYLVIAFFILWFLKSENSFSVQKIIMPSLEYPSGTNDTLITQLSALNLLQYQGQPVDTLLAHLPSGYTTMKIGGWRSQRLAEVLYVIYPNKISVGIHVRNFQYMNPHLVNTSNPTQNWNITEFRKEAITFTIIFNDKVCINGCENKDK